jgi:hypothetical protein
MNSKMPSIAMVLAVSFLGSACDPGLWEYGNLYNPKGVLYRLYVALRTDDANGSTAHYCSITDLKNHIRGTPKIEVCESL